MRSRAKIAVSGSVTGFSLFAYNIPTNPGEGVSVRLETPQGQAMPIWQILPVQSGPRMHTGQYPGPSSAWSNPAQNEQFSYTTPTAITTRMPP